MTSTNHALTGASIGFIIGIPEVAIIVAFLSHFVCDSLPHFGPNMEDEAWLKSKAFRGLLITDAILSVSLVIVILALDPHHALLASVCAFVAASPDLFWLNRFIKLKTRKPWQPSLYSKFASKIQWFQRPLGAIVELLWAFMAIIVLKTVMK